MLADEAYRLLINMRDKNSLSHSLAGQLCDWLELVDEVRFSVLFSICHELDQRTSFGRKENKF